jgi:hypothetical protein
MRLTERKSLGMIIAILAWLMVVLVGYYYVHRPVNPRQTVALGQAVLDIALALLVAGLSGGLGRRLMPARGLTGLERGAVQAALGLGLLAISWLLVGLLNGYERIVAWTLVFLGSVVLRREILEWWREFGELEVIWGASSVFERTLAGACGLLAGWQLLYALAPPLKWDSLIYHLQLPRLYMAAGRFEFLPAIPFWGYPQLAEMADTVGMALRGVETSAAIIWVFMVILVIGVLGMVARYTNANAAWVAVTALMSGISFRGMMSWGYVDGFAGLYGFAALVGMLAWLRDHENAWIMWSGVFAGLAMWAKLTAGLLLPILGATIILEKGLRSRQAWKFGLIVISIALFVFAPWLLINAVTTGNPIYPHIWPTPWTSPERLAYFTLGGSTPGTQLLWLPLAITWFGIESGEIEGVFNYYSDYGPLLLLLALPAICFQWKKMEVRVLTAWLLGGWIAIALVGSYSVLLMQSRYYFFLLPAAALASGFGWQAMEEITAFGIRLRRLLIVCVVLVLGLNLWQDAISLVRNHPDSVILGETSTETYLENNLGWYALAMRTLDSLPGDTRTLFLWEPRGFYAPLNADPDARIDRWFLMRRKYGRPDEILRTWQDQGYTHLLVYKSGAEFEREHRQELSKEDWQALDDLLSQLPPPADFGGAYQLYALNP